MPTSALAIQFMPVARTSEHNELANGSTTLTKKINCTPTTICWMCSRCLRIWNVSNCLTVVWFLLWFAQAFEIVKRLVAFMVWSVCDVAVLLSCIALLFVWVVRPHLLLAFNSQNFDVVFRADSRKISLPRVVKLVLFENLKCFALFDSYLIFIVVCTSIWDC